MDLHKAFTVTVIALRYYGYTDTKEHRQKCIVKWRQDKKKDWKYIEAIILNIFKEQKQLLKTKHSN